MDIYGFCSIIYDDPDVEIIDWSYGENNVVYTGKLKQIPSEYQTEVIVKVNLEDKFRIFIATIGLGDD